MTYFDVNFRISKQAQKRTKILKDFNERRLESLFSILSNRLIQFEMSNYAL